MPVSHRGVGTAGCQPAFHPPAGWQPAVDYRAHHYLSATLPNPPNRGAIFSSYWSKKGDVAFYALNSNYMDKRQIAWMQSEFGKDSSRWKIAFFHHPPYSSGGQHGSSTSLREVVEPLFIQHNISVVFTGHEHFYERIKPQKGIQYFITGAGGKLRDGNVKDNSPLTAKAFHKDLSFMLVEVGKDVMHFQTISRTRQTVDSGSVARRER